MQHKQACWRHNMQLISHYRSLVSGNHPTPVIFLQSTSNWRFSWFVVACPNQLRKHPSVGAPSSWYYVITINESLFTYRVLISLFKTRHIDTFLFLSDSPAGKRKCKLNYTWMPYSQVHYVGKAVVQEPKWGPGNVWEYKVLWLILIL